MEPHMPEKMEKEYSEMTELLRKREYSDHMRTCCPEAFDPKSDVPIEELKNKMNTCHEKYTVVNTELKKLGDELK